MKRLVAALLPVLALTATLRRAGAGAKPLDIYVVDTEGGKAALFVSPTGQSLLIDSGNPGRPGHRSDHGGGRTTPGLKQIDFLISTHYHVDHIGGMAELVKRIPVGHVHRSRAVGRGTREQVQGFQAAYAELYGKAKHIVVKPGDKVPITGLDWRIVTSAGQALEDAAAGRRQAEPGVRRRSRRRRSPTIRDNGQSVGSVVTLRAVQGGGFRRPAVEQGARADVPEQPDRHRRPVPGDASWPRPVELAGARARRCSRASR